jgi:hypothetical protein
VPRPARPRADEQLAVLQQPSRLALGAGRHEHLDQVVQHRRMLPRRRRSSPARQPARRATVTAMWPVIITVLVIVPLLVFAWWRVRER